MHAQINDFVKERKIMSAIQLTSLKMHNTISYLLNAIESWYENEGSRKLNISVFLNFKKAFDTINQSILLSRLALCTIFLSCS